MWILFHGKRGAKLVDDGEVRTEHCPTCETTTRFDEVEIKNSYGLFEIDLVEDTHRVFRCRVCGELFEERERTDERPAPARPARAIAPASKPTVDRSRVEDELAALKKRLGK